MCADKSFCRHERDFHRALTELGDGEDTREALDRLTQSKAQAERMLSFMRQVAAGEPPPMVEVPH